MKKFTQPCPDNRILATGELGTWMGQIEPYWFLCRPTNSSPKSGEGRGCPGGQGAAGTRRQESCEESAGEGFTEGREEGCRQATAESRRDSCCSGGDRVAAVAPLA